MLNSVALLAECTGRARYLLFEVFACKLLKSYGVHSTHTKRQLFRHEEGVREQGLDFLHPITGCSENSPLRVTKTKTHTRNTKCGSTSPSCAD